MKEKGWRPQPTRNNYPTVDTVWRNHAINKKRAKAAYGDSGGWWTGSKTVRIAGTHCWLCAPGCGRRRWWLYHWKWLHSSSSAGDSGLHRMNEERNVIASRDDWHFMINDNDNVRWMDGWMDTTEERKNVPKRVVGSAPFKLQLIYPVELSGPSKNCNCWWFTLLP